MINLVNKLLQISDSSISANDLRRANLLNRISGFSIILASLLNISNLILERYPQLLIITGFVVFIFIPTILMQHYRHYKLARNYYCIAQLALMSGACIFNISNSEYVHSENIFVILSPIFVILYEKELKVFFYSLTIATFFSIRIYDYHVRLLEIDDAFYVSSTIYLVVFMAIYYFISSYMNAFLQVCQYQNLLIDQLAFQKNQLEKTNATKNKLFSIVSHDLQHPIHMLSNLLNMEDQLQETELKSHRKQVEQNVTRINSLIETVLTWAKSQLEGFRIQIEEISIEPFLNSVLLILSEQVKQKKIDINVEVPSDLKIKSDPSHIGLILRNILNNCVKFTPRMGKLAIKVLDHMYHIEFIIEDSGIGMDQETIDDILRGKYIATTLGTSGENGTGLGLALCIETLEKIGGTLQISTIEDGGSRFTVQLSKSISGSQ